MVNCSGCAISPRNTASPIPTAATSRASIRKRRCRHFRNNQGRFAMGVRVGAYSGSKPANAHGQRYDCMRKLPAALGLCVWLTIRLHAAAPQIVPPMSQSLEVTTGKAVTVGVTVSDTDGAADIQGIDVVLWNAAAPANSSDSMVCWMFYSRADKTLWMNQNFNGW